MTSSLHAVVTIGIMLIGEVLMLGITGFGYKIARTAKIKIAFRQVHFGLAIAAMILLIAQLITLIAIWG